MRREVGGSSPPRSDKLYAISRADLPPGLRAAQLGHALLGWAVRYGPPPENLVLLEVPDGTALDRLLDTLLEILDLDEGALDVKPFQEPDLDDELTAVAVDGRARKFLSSLPLAFRDG